MSSSLWFGRFTKPKGKNTQRLKYNKSSNNWNSGTQYLKWPAQFEIITKENWKIENS